MSVRLVGWLVGDWMPTTKKSKKNAPSPVPMEKALSWYVHRGKKQQAAHSSIFTASLLWRVCSKTNYYQDKVLV